jgi:RimJ/RimL family protein N-acetyltransferase
MDYSRYFWQGQLVRLRPLQEDDLDNTLDARLDSPARQVLQLGVELPVTADEARAFLERRGGCNDVNGVIVFAVETLAGERVGGISYHTRDRKNGTFSFGVAIDRPHWGHGYAEDAARILLRYAFFERRYQKCNSACIASNAASVRLHEKLGFLTEGRPRRNVYFDGVHHDELLFGLTIEEFRENDTAYRAHHSPGQA